MKLRRRIFYSAAHRAESDPLSVVVISAVSTIAAVAAITSIAVSSTGAE